jgi:hypothetical protein
MRHDYGPTHTSSSFGIDQRDLRLSEENTNAAPTSGYSSEDSMTFRPYRSTSIMDSNSRPRAHSVPTSPLNFHEPEPDWQRRELHHSMPNINCSFSTRASRQQSIDETEEMHHSLPNMNFESELDFEPEAEYAVSTTTATTTTAMEPVPLNITFTGTRAEQVPSSHAHPHAEYQNHPVDRLTSSRGFALPPHHSHTHSDSISRDLILCLEKLTESTIADPGDDPYAPIPLSPQGPKRRPSLAVNRNDFPKMDDLSPSSTFAASTFAEE